MEPLDADIWRWFYWLNNPPRLLPSALPAPSQPDSLHNWSRRPVAVLRGIATVFFFFFLGDFWKQGGKKRKREKAVPARGHFAALIGDLTVARLQLLERHENSQMSLQAVASLSVWRLKIKGGGKPTAAQSSTLTYLLKKRREKKHWNM